MSMETIRKTEPMQNINHDLIQLLSVKLDSAARYELYKKDAEGNAELQRLFDRLGSDEMKHIELLNAAIKKQMESNNWK